MSGGDSEGATRLTFEQYMMGASTVTANTNDHTDDTKRVQKQENELEQQRNLQIQQQQ